MKRNKILPLQILLLLCACGGYTQPTLPGPGVNSFTAGKTLITAGESTTLTADFVNGAAVIDHGVGPVIDDLAVPVTPSETTTYTLTDSDAAGHHVSRSVTVQVVPMPAVPVIQPPASVEPGQTGLTASVAPQAGCTYLWTVNAQGGVITAGAQSPNVTFSTAAFGVLTLSCTVSNAAGRSAASHPISFVLGGPEVEISADPDTITEGETCVLAFTFSGGSGVLSAPGQPEVQINAGETSLSVTPTVTTTYTFTVTSSKGEVFSQTVTVTVDSEPTITLFSASPAVIGPGATTTLNAVFASGPGVTASVDEGVGPVESRTAIDTGTLEHSTTFTLTVTNAAGNSVSATTRVLVGSLARLAGVPSGEGSIDGLAARYQGPAGVAQDAAGNLLVADTQNHTIRKIDPTGKVTTLAGQEGEPGSADGAGGSARFNLPMGLAVDPATGDLLVADSGNDTIRLVTPGGAVSTLAGSAGQPGNLDGVGTGASLNHPTGITLGAKDGVTVLFMADSGNATIRMIELDNQKVSTLTGVAGMTGDQDGAAGTTGAAGEALFSAPAGLAWSDADQLLYVADAGNNSIRQVNPAGEVVTLAGASAGLSGPQGLALSGQTLYVADTGNSVLRAITLGSDAVSLVAGAAGDPGATDAPALFDRPQGLTLDAAGDLIVADTGNATLRKVTAAGGVSTISGQHGAQGSANGAGSVAEFRAPRGVALAAGGVLYVADQGNHVIRKVEPDGAVSPLAGEAGVPGSSDSSGTGSGGARFNLPAAVAVDSAGDVIVADQGNHTIRRIAPDGTVTTLAGLAGTAGAEDSIAHGSGGARFNHPSGVAVAANGDVIVADRDNHAIRLILPDGTVSTLATGFSAPTGVALTEDGLTIYVADPGDATVRKLVHGQVTILAGKAGHPGSVDGSGGTAQLDQPCAIALDEDGRLFVSNSGSSTVCLITPAGAVSTILGSPARSENLPGPLPALISAPWGITVDPHTGNIYVTIDDALMKADFTQ